jgi:acetyl esterase/lipase
LTHLYKRLNSEGFNVVALPYRYLPDVVWPEIVKEVKSTIEYVINGNIPNVKAQQFHLLGRSAGGFLAAYASALISDDRLKTTTCIYPICSIEDWSDEKPANEILNSREIYQRLLGIENKKDEKSDWPTDIRNLKNIKNRNHLILSGDFDPFVDYRQSGWLNEKLKAQGVKSELVIFPNESHGFDLTTYSFAGQIFLQRIINFMRSHEAS